MKNKIVILSILMSMIALTACEDDSVKTDMNNLMITSSSVENETKGNIYVYVTGEVKTPGVYCLKENARICDAIEAAGGMTKKAQKDYLNQAEKIVDGQEIKIISKKQYRDVCLENKNESYNTKTDSENGSSNQSDKVNINTAESEELMNLSGIGETKAKAIVLYREENGNFSTIEDIKNVSGIGEATFDSIREQITV